MQNVLCKLILEFWIEPQDLDESRNVETFEITVGQGSDVTTGLDDDFGAVVVMRRHFRTGVFAVAQVFVDVAAYQVAFAYKKITCNV